MAWTGFSAEAVNLDSQLRRFHRDGKISEAILAIESALRKAHTDGPSNISYEAFEATASLGAEGG